MKTSWKKTKIPIQNVCVFCAASPNTLTEYIEGGYILGTQLALNNFVLYYGGGEKGVMGSLADGYLDHSGKEIQGVITKHLIGKEVKSGKYLSVCTKDMHARKEFLIKNSDCFIVTAGGIGTFDELFEVLCLKDIGEINKPIYVYDPVNEMFSKPLKKFLKQISKLGVLSPTVQDQIVYTDSVCELIALLQEGLYK